MPGAVLETRSRLKTRLQWWFLFSEACGGGGRGEEAEPATTQRAKSRSKGEGWGMGAEVGVNGCERNPSKPPSSVSVSCCVWLSALVLGARSEHRAWQGRPELPGQREGSFAKVCQKGGRCMQSTEKKTPAIA